MRLPVAPPPHPCFELWVSFCFSVFLDLSHLDFNRYVVVSHYFNLQLPKLRDWTELNMYYIGHLFLCLCAICVSSLVRCLPRSLNHFKLDHSFFFFLIAELEAFFVYFACKLSDMCFSNIFSQCLTCLFIPLMEFYFKKPMLAQWYKIRLSMQETRVQFLIWEDFTCHGATKPVCHSHSACALEPRGCNDRGHMP